MTKQDDGIRAQFTKETVITENSDAARELHDRNRFGALLPDGRLQLSLPEALYLIEKKKMGVQDGRGKQYEFERFLKKATRLEPQFWVRYCVLRDMRDRGYIIKTALKFGADFRVYERGVKPGEDHAKWIVYPVAEASAMTWYEFAAKNRVAHSTRKRLLIGVVDEEADVSYWEIRWMRP